MSKHIIKIPNGRILVPETVESEDSLFVDEGTNYRINMAIRLARVAYKRLDRNSRRRR